MKIQCVTVYLRIALFVCLVSNLSAMVRLDGDNREWEQLPLLEWTDAIGDGYRTGADFAALRIYHDGPNLFLSLQFAPPYPSGSPDVSFYFDVDGDAETGFYYNETGVDATWDMADGSGNWSLGSGWSLNRGNFLIRSAYNSLSGVLEAAFPIGLLTKESGAGFGLSLVAGDSLDRLVDFGNPAIQIELRDPIPVQRETFQLEKYNSNDLRILSWNVLRDAPLSSGMESRFGRILEKARPDIVCFQELYEASVPWVIDFMNRWVPLNPAEGFWTARKRNDCITVSRFPIDEVEFVDANLITLIDTRELLGRRSWILNAHTPCCENSTGRISETDNFMARLRQRKAVFDNAGSGESPFAIFLVGDMNTGGSEREMLTMTEGLIFNELTDGPSFYPDWDGTSLVDLAPMHTHEQRIDTWRSLNNQSNTSRLDYIIYSDSVVVPTNSYVLNTRRVPVTFLNQNGLLATDTDGADHLPIIGDFRQRDLEIPFGDGLLEVDGWSRNGWLGDLYCLEIPYYYSVKLGWLYASQGSLGWVYSYARGWVWMSPNFPNWIFDAQLMQWQRV